MARAREGEEENGGEPHFIPAWEREDLIIRYDGFTPVQWPTDKAPWDDSPDLSQPRIKTGSVPAPTFPDFSWHMNDDPPVVTKGFVTQTWPGPLVAGTDLSQQRIKDGGAGFQTGDVILTDGFSTNSPPPKNPAAPWANFTPPEPDTSGENGDDDDGITRAAPHAAPRRRRRKE